MPDPDEGSFYTPGPKGPGVQVGEELVMGLTPSSEMQIRLGEVERKLGIKRDPLRFPRTTQALEPEGNPPAPNPRQGVTGLIQNFIDSLPPFKLPPLPPLPPLPVFPASKPNPLIRERVSSPPEVTEEVAVVSKELNPQTGIIPLVYE